MHRIFDTRLLLLQLSFCSRADSDHRDTANEFGKTLPATFRA